MPTNLMPKMSTPRLLSRTQCYLPSLQLMFVSVATNSHKDFSKLANAAFQMMKDKHHVEASGADRTAILDGLKTLLPFPDAAEGLSILRDKGLRLAAFTNEKLQSARAHLRKAKHHRLLR
ncbi:MAG: hypothetical protein ABR577_08730 [Pyrinomonadaceae bacterium]